MPTFSELKTTVNARTRERIRPALTPIAVIRVLARTPSNAPSGEVHARVESPLLEAAEAGAAKVEAGGDELNVPLLKDVLDDLRRGIGSISGAHMEANTDDMEGGGVKHGLELHRILHALLLLLRLVLNGTGRWHHVHAGHLCSWHHFF